MTVPAAPRVETLAPTSTANPSSAAAAQSGLQSLNVPCDFLFVCCIVFGLRWNYTKSVDVDQGYWRHTGAGIVGGWCGIFGNTLKRGLIPGPSFLFH